ncbi:nucleotide exchange factor Fes1-domain-containing protein [Rhodocollybia butyracea]|uniref:Nucleotide exchange factor Fes1-domain-containing protein n=1 Tax=Rhodocollybia butyracea TaxID=206335 RepID=A0A9P5QCN9_9AGAR|nr:nucleotide exchange factor Fes1-domain-containing protein [Rhodocollybia butyracea]
MQSLLRWGIENSTPQDNTNSPVERKDLNPEIIDLLLGKSDAQLMKEAMEVAVDRNRSEDDRIVALDNLEMLVEQIDNASNLENLKMWEPLHALLTSSTDAVITQAVWVIGTALQNNPSAQDAYLKLNPLPTLTSFLSPKAVGSSKQTRSKVIYALSGLLKHNAPALRHLNEEGADGWNRLRQSLQDPDITVRRKTAFLLSSLLTPNETALSSSSENLHTPDSQRQQAPIHANSHAAHLSQPNRASTSALTLEAMNKYDILGTLIEGLTNPLPYGENGDKEGADEDFEEKSIALLRTYLVVCNGTLEQTQKNRLREWMSSRRKEVEKDAVASSLAERWGMSSGELDQLVQKVE